VSEAGTILFSLETVNTISVVICEDDLVSAAFFCGVM
jgi:hypothetical protein